MLKIAETYKVGSTLFLVMANPNPTDFATLLPPSPPLPSISLI